MAKHVIEVLGGLEPHPAPASLSPGVVCIGGV